MRRLLCSIVAVLSLAAVFPVSAGNVVIARPRIIWVSPEAVTGICSAVRPVTACTTLKNLMLMCDCIEWGGRWQRQVRISASPAMYTTNGSLLLHEMQHLADFRWMLAEYARTIEARTFQTLTECEAAADRVRAGFNDEMIAIRDESARRRDHTATASAVRSIKTEWTPQVIVRTTEAEDVVGEGGGQAHSETASAAADPTPEPEFAGPHGVSRVW